MGATYDEVDFDGKHSETELKKLFRDYQDHCSYESGNNYSGCLNMCHGLDIQTRTFECYQDAVTYIEDHAQKWGAAIAVRYKHAEKTKEFPASVKKLSEQVKTAEHALHASRAANLEAWQAIVKASKFVTCGACKSKLSASHIGRDTWCPVCRSLMASDKATIKLEVKVTQLRVKLEAKRKEVEKQAAMKSKTTRWLVGGWCAS